MGDDFNSTNEPISLCPKIKTWVCFCISGCSGLERLNVEGSALSEGILHPEEGLANKFR